MDLETLLAERYSCRAFRPQPAADEVAPWVVSMIRNAGPFPAPANVGTSNVRYFEIWLVDRSGQFQVDSLTEGQRVEFEVVQGPKGAQAANVSAA